jgi:hypothetical protein
MFSHEPGGLGRLLVAEAGMAGTPLLARGQGCFALGPVALHPQVDGGGGHSQFLGHLLLALAPLDYGGYRSPLQCLLGLRRQAAGIF